MYLVEKSSNIMHIHVSIISFLSGWKENVRVKTRGVMEAPTAENGMARK